MPSPTSAYLNYVGLAKVSTDTVLATPAAATATTVKVASATGITTASTIVILDGPLTEVKAVTTVTTTTLTVSALAHAHLKGTYIFALPTSGFGPTAYVPLKTFKVPDKYAQLYDESRRGSLVDKWGVAQGMRTSEWSFEGDVFADTFGYLLGGFFGAETYTAGTPTPPNTHAFSGLNTGNGQPVKYAYFVYDGTNCRVVVGRITKLALKYDPKALLSYSATLMARASGVVTTPTTSYSTQTPLPTWRATLSIAGTYSRLPLAFTIDLTRAEAENIPTMTGTQDPLDTFVGAVEVSGKATYVKEGDTQLNAYLNGTVQALTVTLSMGTGATKVGLKLHLTKANYDAEETVLQGKAYNTEDASFSGIANTTDATAAGGGSSPIKVTLSNAIGSSVYV